MGEETKPAVSRRGLLRRAGTVAAGVGVVGAASAVAATPALAANGDAVTVGGTFTGTAKTSLTSGDGSNAALKVANANSAGAPLELGPVNLDVNGNSPVSPSLNAVGTTYVDRWGDVHVVGDAQGAGGGAHYDNMLYSPTWALMPVPLPAQRIVSTYVGDIGNGGRALCTFATAPDSQGRVQPTNQPADMIIDLSSWVNGGSAAIVGNLSIGLATAEGYCALWDEGAWQGNSSINFPKSTWLANYTQTIIGSDLKIRVKVSAPAVVVFDLADFIMADPFAQLNFPGAAASGPAARAFAAAKQRRAITPRH